MEHKTINVIGCDPGAKGAVCLLQAFPDKEPKITFIDFTQDIDVLIKWFMSNCKDKYITISMLENVHSLPLVSAKANFNFGKNLGIIETLLKAQKFGLDTVTPKVWQKYLGVSIPTAIKGNTRKLQTKNKVAELCERLYPGCEIRGLRGGLKDGRSDALGIAHYALHKYK